MINVLSTTGHTTYGLKEFVLDTKADVENLSIDVPPGSSAFVITTGDVYMLNTQHSWVLIGGGEEA